MDKCVDIDGNVYKTVKIGNQIWMAENLKVTHYRNGEAIPNITDGEEWIKLLTGACCSYDNKPENAVTYGLLYNWFAVNDSRGLAPAGWRIPSDEEWKQLEMHLGMSQSEADGIYSRGPDEGGKLKESGMSHWNNPNEGATNESGFSALPGGYRNYYYGYFYGLGYDATFWSSSENYSVNAWYRGLGCYYSGSYRSFSDKQNGFSVRCIK